MRPEPDAEPNRILVVEDEQSIRDVVATALRYSGHTIVEAADGQAGYDLAMEGNIDLIVLDVTLPHMDGFELCRRLRDRGHFSPVLFLTAKDKPADRIKGFVTGGDDYLPKPFSVDELVLRVQAILRRTRPSGPSDVLRVADLTLEPAGLEVRRGGALIDLSPTEFRLLHYLMTNAGIVCSKPQILTAVWDYDYDGSDNVVELYIGYLRRKIDDGRIKLIHTRRGAGYVIRQPSS